MTTVIPSSLKSGEAEWSPAIFGKLGALRFWKSLVHGDKEILGQSQHYSKDLTLKALRNIANPNLNKINYNLYCLELSSFQHNAPPAKKPNC